MKLENPVLKILVPTHRSDQIAFILQEEGALAIEERDIHTMTAAATDFVEFVAGFEDDAARSRATAAISAIGIEELTITRVDDMDDDWQTKWREFFRPQVFNRLQVITPWMDPPLGDRMTIVIDPGQAFGTGGHATTKLVIEFLEDLHENGELPNHVLDVGTGSGILSFAASMLGATHILGVDIDPESKIAFDDNARRNGLATRDLSCVVGGAADVVGTWPLVLANIQIDAFRVCHDEVAQRVAPSGTLIISGILTEQIDELETLFPGFKTVHRKDDGEWVALRLSKPQ